MYMIPLAVIALSHLLADSVLQYLNQVVPCILNLHLQHITQEQHILIFICLADARCLMYLYVCEILALCRAQSLYILYIFRTH